MNVATMKPGRRYARRKGAITGKMRAERIGAMTVAQTDAKSDGRLSEITGREIYATSTAMTTASGLKDAGAMNVMTADWAGGGLLPGHGIFIPSQSIRTRIPTSRPL